LRPDAWDTLDDTTRLRALRDGFARLLLDPVHFRVGDERRLMCELDCSTAYDRTAARAGTKLCHGHLNRHQVHPFADIPRSHRAGFGAQCNNVNRLFTITSAKWHAVVQTVAVNVPFRGYFSPLSVSRLDACARLGRCL